jgi:glycosyltransferase involved in cell wall biosynthesis
MLEAMAAGCVVVASRTAPVTEVIEDRRNGFLVDFFNAGEIAQRVAEALERRSELAGIRRQARRTVVGRYHLNRVCLSAQLKLLGVPAKKAAAR